MARKAASLERNESTDPFFGVNFSREKAKGKRGKKFESGGRGKNEKGSRKIDLDKNIEKIDYDTKSKDKKGKRKASKEMPKAEKPIISSEEIEKIKVIENDVKNLTNEFNDRFIETGILNDDHYKGIEYFLERGGRIIDRFNKKEYSNDLIDESDKYLKEGLVLLNGLKIIYKNRIDEKYSGGENISIPEEVTGNKVNNSDVRLDEDVARNSSPNSHVYLNEEIPEDLKIARKRYGKTMKPADRENNQNKVSGSTDEYRSENEPVILKTEGSEGLNGLPALPENESEEIESQTDQEAEFSERMRYSLPSYLEGAKDLLKLVREGRKRGLFQDVDTQEKEKEYVRTFIQDSMVSCEGFSFEEIKQMEKNIIDNLFRESK